MAAKTESKTPGGSGTRTELQDPNRSWLRKHGVTILVLVLCIALAGFLRVAFNYEPATSDGIRYAGNDDYYHLAVVETVQLTGEHVVVDPLLNYPVPNTKNPRPPVYDWSVAIGGQTLAAATPLESSDAGKYALLWGSALWGSIIGIPVWLIGRTLYSNAAGLWAAFLIAASPANVQRSGFGLGDHDAFILFFLVLGAFFLVKSLRSTRDERFVGDWSSVSSVAEGFSTYVARHPTALAYSVLAGVSWATIALMWEGFPYVLAVYSIYYFFQILANQIRRRDSTGDFLSMLTVIGTLLILALPYYWIHGNISGTTTTAVYIVLGLLLLSGLLVFTRDLPWVLVVPSLLGVGALGLVIITFVFPEIGRQIFTANGYFVQTRLYTTIAEAQRTDLGVFVFSVGFMTFFLSLVGLGFAVQRVLGRWERTQVFMVAWGLVALFMAFAASRFVFNATPVFAILGGWVTWRMTRWIDFRRSRRGWVSMRPEGVVRASRASLNPKVVLGTFFLIMTLVLPNLWFSVDAGIPGEFRATARQSNPEVRDLLDNRTGAFGQGFLARDWVTIFEWLGEQDTHLAPADRPGFMAWWDYGFWEIALARHPTVAENFQHGYECSGRFLAAQSEQEGIEWFIIRILEGSRATHRGFPDDVRSYLEGLSPGLAADIEPLTRPVGYDAAQLLLRAAVPTEDQTVQVYEDLSRMTGFRISYFLTDARMLPYDDPRTRDIEAGSIFYAPVFLANKNPDEFVQTVYEAGDSQIFTVHAYERTSNGDVVGVRPQRISDGFGANYTVSGGNLYRLTPDNSRIDYGFNGGVGVPIQAVRLVYHDSFYETMYYKGFIGGERPAQGNFPSREVEPGQGMRHFRLVKDTDSVKLLKYYAGAPVTGTVRSHDGQPIPGAQVVVYDDMGISHDGAVTDQNGSFSLLAPFGIADASGNLQGTRFEARHSGVSLGSQNLTITEDAANRLTAETFTVDFAVEPVTVEGFVFMDRDRDGAYNVSVDSLPAGAPVRITGGPETIVGEDGRFSLPNAPAGGRTLEVLDVQGYEDLRRSLTLTPGGVQDLTLPMTLSRVSIEGSITAENETTVEGYQVNFTALQPDSDFAQNASLLEGGLGRFQGSVYPGSYRATVDHEAVEEGRTVRYVGSADLVFDVGQELVVLSKDDLNVQRVEQA